MKKVFKVIGILFGLIVLAVAVFFVVQQIKTHKTLNDPRLPDNYYESVRTGGELEAKYLGKGNYATDHITVKSDNKSVKNIYIYYPAELKTSGKQYPLVMVVNGSQTPAKTYMPFFERLASWGFIVVGNDDPQPGTGETASITLDYVLNESEIKDSVDKTIDLIEKVDDAQTREGCLAEVLKYKLWYDPSLNSEEKEQLTEQKKQAAEMIKRYITKIKTEGIEDDDFTIAKKAVYGDIISSLNSVSNISNIMADYHFNGNELFTYIDAVASAEKADVERRLSEMLDVNNCTLSVVNNAAEGGEI